MRLIIAGLAALVLPGYAWLAWFPRPGRSPIERLAEAVGLSLALIGLAALACFLLGIHLSSLALGAITAALLAATVTGRLAHRRPLKFGWEAGLGFLALAGLIAWRLYQSRSLVLPAWVDSIHHTLIVRLILETGGLPATLDPYIPVPFYYHYAFHAVTAVFTAFSGLSPEQAVLLFGQGLNAVAALSVYHLGKTLWGDAKRAGLAALLVGFAIHMPAYYLTWGRYTLLAGLVLLPIAMSAALEVSQSTSIRKEAVARLAVLTGGLFVAHYLAAMLFALFLLALGAGWLWGDLRRRQLNRLRWAGIIAGVGTGVLLALPWVFRVWQYSSGSFQIDAGPSSGTTSADYVNYLWYLAGPQRNRFLFLLGGLGLLWALRRSSGRALSAWSLAIALLSLPWTIRLGPFRPDHWEIVLFLPVSLLAADLLVSAAEALGKRLAAGWGWAGGLLACLGLCLWGTLETANILNPVTILADREDVTALQWVAEDTPPEARIYINTAFWQGNAYRGVDGGWWALPLTGRKTLLPPAPYDWGDRGYTQQITTWARQASQIHSCSPEFYDLLRQAQIDYIYIHAGKGSLQAEALQPCAGIREAYANGVVTIFEVTAR